MIAALRSCLVLLVIAAPIVGHAQMSGGPPAMGAPPGAPMGPRDHFIGPPSRVPGSSRGEPPFGGLDRSPGARTPLPGSPPDSGSPGNVVPLGNAVSMVQERFNATAVKTDTVWEGEQLVYRIRLLSADKARVWTVRVDAQTGQIK